MKKYDILLMDVCRSTMELLSYKKITMIDKSLYQKVYIETDQLLFQSTGKYFMELEYPNSPIPYTRSKPIEN